MTGEVSSSVLVQNAAEAEVDTRRGKKDVSQGRPWLKQELRLGIPLYL